MLVLAHRGLSAHYVENTQIAFEKAIEKGAKAIECDVHQVGDEFIIFHDYDLKRLCSVEGNVANIKVDEITQLKVKGTHPILTLSEFLALFAPRVMINLELKSIQQAHTFVHYLEECIHKLDSFELTLSSFNHPLLQSLQRLVRDTRLDKKLTFAALVGHLPHDGANYAISLGVDVAACDAHLVNHAFVEQAHQYNLSVWCYTVNDEGLLKALYEMGVDGIFSDDVEWANTLISRICTDDKALD